MATFSIIRGLAFVLSNGQTNLLSNEAFKFIGRGNVVGIPFSLLLMLALYLIFAAIYATPRSGRNLYAIGGSPDASRLAGITVTPHLLTVYILSGLLAAFSGVITVSQLASSAPRAAVGLEFTVITAVVLGGTSLTGGKGTPDRHADRRDHPAHPGQRSGADRSLVVLPGRGARRGAAAGGGL